jgi:hypothetical protein
MTSSCSLPPVSFFLTYNTLAAGRDHTSQATEQRCSFKRLTDWPAVVACSPRLAASHIPSIMTFLESKGNLGLIWTV